MTVLATVLKRRVSYMSLDAKAMITMSHQQFGKSVSRWRLLKQCAILHVERMGDAIVAGTAH